MRSSSRCSRRQRAASSASGSCAEPASAARVIASIWACFLGLDQVGLQRAALIVGVGRRQETGRRLVARTRRRPRLPAPASASPACPFVKGRIGGGTRRLCGLRLLPVALDGPPMHREAAGERLDRRQQPLLQSDHEQTGGGLGLAGRGRMPCLAGGAVLVKQVRQRQLGGVCRQSVDVHTHDAPRGEAAPASRGCPP